MNIYTTEFFAFCPNNNIRIHYTWIVESKTLLKVEDLIEKVSSISKGYHEEIADELFKTFGQTQTMRAFHHGVHIETKRTST